MVLSDRAIREEIRAGRIVIEPLADGSIQPASVDVRLDRRVLVLGGSDRPYVDLRQDLTGLAREVVLEEDEPLLLGSGECALAGTIERVELPDDIVARIEARSSLNRVGLFVHSSAGYVDPGWRGHLTLGITNAAALPITLYAGMPIGQISFMRLESPAERPYGSGTLASKYQDQAAATPSLAHLNFPGRDGPAAST